MNSRPIFPNLSGQFPPIDQHMQTFTFGLYGASHPIHGTGLQNAVPAQMVPYQPGALHIPDPPQESLVSVPPGAAVLSDAELTETPMGPPPKRRKRKAPTLRAKDWEPYKARIIELHEVQKLTLKEIKATIEQNSSFTATLRQYQGRISQWDKDKNIKPREMAAVVRKRQQRKLVEVDKREQTFTVRGRKVEPRKIDRWMAKEKVPHDELYVPSPAASTPSAVGCQTISERDSVASSPAYSITSLTFSRGTTPIVTNPTAPTPIPSVWEIADTHNTAFTGQSPALIYEPPTTLSYSADPNDVFDKQLHRRYRQDEEERIREELSVTEDELGINHSQTCKLRIDLGYVLLFQGRYKSAEETARRAIQDCQRHESNSVLVIDAIELLIDILSFQDSLDQAEKLAESLVESKKAIMGQEHPSTLESMKFLSILYAENGKSKDASELCTQTLNIIKRTLGEGHPQTIEYMLTLEVTYRELGQLSRAEELVLQVLQVRTELLGKMHKSTITTMSQLALIYRLQERLKDAEELEVQSVDLSILLVGEEHPDTLEHRLSLAQIYEDQGQLKDAQDLCESVVVVMKKVHGEQHPKTLMAMSSLMRIYMDQGRLDGAENLGVQLLIASKRVFGEQHSDTLRTVKLMEIIYEAQEELSEAEGSEE